MVEIGGQVGPHDDPFRDGGSKAAQRIASLSQVAFLMSYLRPYLSGGGADPRGPDTNRQRAASTTDSPREGLRRDAWHVARFLWGGRQDDGGWQPGQRLNGAYEAWLRAAGQVRDDPLGARMVMELCGFRMAGCPGGPELLLLYTGHVYDGVDSVDAMRRAWSDTAAVRAAGVPGRAHDGSPTRSRLGHADPDPAHLPAVVDPRLRPETGRGPADPRATVVEAARLLGVPDVTVPHLREFQQRHAELKTSNAATLARRWLADLRQQGVLNPRQHHTWRAAVEQAAAAAVKRVNVDSPAGLEPGTHPAGTPEPATQAEPDGPDRASAAAGDHIAGHAAAHHRTGDRELGRAVDDPRTPHVDEQDSHRQRASVERKTAEVYETMAGQDGDGLRARATAARPAPSGARTAASPAQSGGRSHPPAPVARPAPPAVPSTGRGVRP